ncbi:MAG: 50S ribosomal protein L25 [Spirochaetes bacterium]|nr:50S ribosomal protein L25 [Spirochaetota bacterium]
MSAKSLTAVKKDSRGKNNNNRLRSEGFIPAVVYSHGKSESIKVKEKELQNLFKGHILESVIFDLHIEGQQDIMAFVKSFQKDPVTGKILHLDLFRVTKSEKIKTHVPIELLGTPAGLKLGGILQHGERELLIQCLPGDLPEKITVDISALLPGEIIHVGDVKHGEKIEILTTAENIIVAVEKTKAASEEGQSGGETTEAQSE